MGINKKLVRKGRRVYHCFMTYHRVKGCYDVLPEADEPWKEPALWQFVFEKARAISAQYGFKEAILPAFEYTEVFTRSSGEESDIVAKEMYTFTDKGGRSVSLRPELTAPFLRAYIEAGMHQKSCDRFFYIGPCWRYDRSQKGRYRQFYQFGIEIIGQNESYVDVEAIAMLLDFYHALGLKNISLALNSIGDKETRKRYEQALREYFRPYLGRLSEDSQRRFETNPLRILDSKAECDKELVKDAPSISSFLSDAAKERFDFVCGSLEKFSIPFVIDHNLVRGLDYYCDTVFEVVRTSDTGRQNSLGGGGRYDGLMKDLGGPDYSGIGFGTGIERICQMMVDENLSLPTTQVLDYYLIPLDDSCKKVCFNYLMQIRKQGHSALLHYKNYNVKKALRAAENANAHYAIIIGEEELHKNQMTIKDLFNRNERVVPVSVLLELTNENRHKILT